jgi:hypothetical protein
MRWITTLLFTAASVCCTGQKKYIVSYKLVQLKETVAMSNNSSTNGQLLSDIVLSNLVYTFSADKNLCYLKNVSTFSDTKGINTSVSGKQQLYVSYAQQSAAFELPSDSVVGFLAGKFIKNGDAVKTYGGFILNRYTSEDSMFVLYTAKALPWFVQPCLFTTNAVGEGVVIFENLRSHYALELVSYSVDKAASADKAIALQMKKSPKRREPVLSPFFE